MNDQKFGLIINPYAKQIQKKYLAPKRRFWEALLEPEEYALPEEPDKVGDAIARQLDRGVQTLGILGGDGTVHLVLDKLLRLNPRRMPAILAFRGGTVNALCNNLGNKDAPEETLKKLVGILPSHPLQINKRLIRVEESGDDYQNVRFGFSFANGVLVGCYNEYYRAKTPALSTALKIIFKIFATGMINLGAGPGLLAPVEMKVHVPGKIDRQGKFRVVVASVLDNPTLWWRPFGAELNGRPEFHYLVNYMNTRELAWNLLDLLAGKVQHPLHAVGQTGEVCLESEGGYIMDGEVFGMGQKLSIRITLGPALKFISLYP